MDATLSRGDGAWFLVYPLLLTTEQMEHTEANPRAVMPFFRVFGVFRGSLFLAARTPNRPVTLIARGLSPVSCHPGNDEHDIELIDSSDNRGA